MEARGQSRRATYTYMVNMYETELVLMCYGVNFE